MLLRQKFENILEFFTIDLDILTGLVIIVDKELIKSFIFRSREKGSN